MNVFVTICTDDDGFYGNQGFDHLNTDETYRKYTKEIEREIKHFYPDFIILFEYKNCCQRGVEVEGRTDYQDLEDEINEMVANVYERGNFWTFK